MSKFDEVFIESVNRMDNIDADKKKQFIEIGQSIISCEEDYQDGTASSVKPKIKAIIEKFTQE